MRTRKKSHTERKSGNPRNARTETGQVRWRETVEFIAANGVTTAIEAGSGKVLTGLARRISRDIKGVPVGAPGDIEAALAALG